MHWFKKHKKISVMLAVIIVLLAVFAVSAIKGGELGIGNSILSITSKVHKPVSNAGDSAGESITGIFRFKAISKENQKLKEEIQILKEDLIKQKLKKKDLKDLKKLSQVLNYKEITKSYSLVSANVVAINGFSWFNIFTIDRGTSDNIKKNDIVVSGEGLVGRILSAGKDTAKVIGISDESNNVSFMVLRNPDYLGVLQGDGKGGLSGFMLDDKAQVIEGDELVTSGMGVYPAGIPVGKVESVKMDRNTLLKTVKISPAASFRSITKVVVLT